MAGESVLWALLVLLVVIGLVIVFRPRRPTVYERNVTSIRNGWERGRGDG